jgi:hypothetical protein
MGLLLGTVQGALGNHGAAVITFKDAVRLKPFDIPDDPPLEHERRSQIMTAKMCAVSSNDPE